MGFKKADDFYVAIGAGKVPVGQIVPKVLGKLKTSEVVMPEADLTITRRRSEAAGRSRPASASWSRARVDSDVLVRMAKCCTPVPGDDVVGYISLGRGITVHRDDCPNVRALKRNPERFTAVSWDDGESATARSG